MIAVTLAVLFGLLALTVPIAATLGVLGLTLDQFYSFLPLTVMMGEIAWTGSTSFILVAVPFFILLGEILLRAGIAERMYNAMIQWVSWLPGGLMHSNIAACALFAATSGSSVATAATIGTVSLGEVKKYKYNERLFLGTITAGGTLGILIPPSINMIIYGVLTDTSIPQLYLAGFVPGFVLAALFMLTVVIACRIKRSWSGIKPKTTWDARIKSLPDLIPPLLIFIVVIGSIYSGLATPTESAALGVIGALILAAWKRRLTFAMLRQALEGTMRTTAMIMAIILAALFLNAVFASIGLSYKVNSLITELGLSPMETLIIVIIFYFILGMVMDTLSMMLATVPIIAPVIISLGFDPIWFGILIMLLNEASLITPPVGGNLFVVQGIRQGGQIHDVMIGTLPFVVTLMVMIVVLVLFPDIALWLPSVFSN